MKINILFKGYALVAGQWIQLSDKLIFPEEIVRDDPFDYAQELMKQADIKYYLITYDKIKTKE